MNDRRMVLGLGNCVDYEVEWNAEVYEELIRAYGLSIKDLEETGRIASERDLLAAILRMVKDGKGGECYVSSIAIVEQFASRFRKRITLGGTSIRAAIAMERMGACGAALHLVTMNEHVLRLLPKSASYICSEGEKGIYPHLIIQYYKHAVIQAGDIRIDSPRENRIIFVNDPDNCQMRLSEKLPELLQNAELFLISGFNVIRDAELLEKRVRTLRKMMTELNESAVVFFEDAGYHTPSLSAVVRDGLIDRIQLYSMNEDEWQAYVGRRVNLLDCGDVLDGLESVHGLIPAPTILIHTQYWALAYGRDARRYASALEGGVVMAGTRMRSGDGFTPADYEAAKALAPRKEGENFAAGLQKLNSENVCCVPAKQIDVPRPVTIGLGDAFVGGFLLQME